MIRLKELREEQGWSMRRAAEFLGQKYTTYVNHEKEYREPNSEDLKSYAHHYGVSIDYLVGRTDKKEPATESDGLVQEPLLKWADKDVRLLKWFRSLPPEKQKAILTAQDAPEGLL